MRMYQYFIIGFLGFVFLLWVYPNLIHEPLHLLALKVQGVDGKINFDWSFPPHPYITRVGVIPSVAGSLFFVLAPSIFSLVMLCLLFLSRRNPGFLTHIVFAFYLLFDLFENIRYFGTVYSDFHFFILFPFLAYACLFLITSFAIYFLGVVSKNLWGDKNEF